MECFQRGELLRQPPPSSTSLRRCYFLSCLRSSHDVAAPLQPVVAAPVRLGCRDLLHSALVTGRLCQVRAARHCSFLDSVFELLTDDPSCLEVKKQRVAKVVMDAWLTTARLRGGQVLEASSRTFFVSHTPLPSASAGLLGPVLRDGLGSLVCYAASGGMKKYVCIFFSFPVWGLLSSLRSRRSATAISTLFSRRGAAALSTPLDVAASLLPAVAAPVRLDCRDLLHSALASGHLCQVRAARHCSFLDSEFEQLTGNPPNLGSKKQRVVKVVMDAWLATAGLRGGQILEARFPTFAASHPLLPSASAAPQGSVRRDGRGSSVVSPCYAVSGGMQKYFLSSAPHTVGRLSSSGGIFPAVSCALSYGP